MPSTMSTLVPLAKPDALYFTDNGAVLCGEHLGASAKYSLRDISGQRITRVTRADAAYAKSEGFTVRCESCHKEVR